MDVAHGLTLAGADISSALFFAEKSSMDSCLLVELPCLTFCFTGSGIMEWQKGCVAAFSMRGSHGVLLGAAAGVIEGKGSGLWETVVR